MLLFQSNLLKWKASNTKKPQNCLDISLHTESSESASMSDMLFQHYSSKLNKLVSSVQIRIAPSSSDTDHSFGQMVSYLISFIAASEQDIWHGKGVVSPYEVKGYIKASGKR